MTVTWRRDVPEAVRTLDTLAEPDYCDVFTATSGRGGDVSADRWLRGLTRDAPVRIRLVLGLARSVQRTVLGLRPEPGPRGDLVMGWRLAERHHDWLRLEAASWFMTGHLVLMVDGPQVSLATFVRYERRAGALIWPPVSVLHRVVGLVLMRHAERHMRAGSSTVARVGPVRPPIDRRPVWPSGRR